MRWFAFLNLILNILLLHKTCCFIKEENAFVVIYDNYKKTLDLLAPNEIERDRWVRVLSYFILLTKKRKGVLPETDK
jgi:hypothetical protein